MLKQKLQQKLLQKLSPQQIQMIKLLEVPTMQLEQRIKKEIEENPALEEGSDKDDLLGNDNDDENFDDDKEKDEFTLDDYLNEEDTPTYKLSENNYSKNDEIKEILFSAGLSFQEYLLSQLGVLFLTEQKTQLAEYVIGNIDEDGYLHRELAAIVDDLAFSQNIFTTKEKLTEIVKIIQTLDPPGVAAKNLKECLLLQINRKDTLVNEINNAKRILKITFEEFTKKHYDKIISKLNITEDELKKAIAEILKLNPKPGSSFSEQEIKSFQTIIPDFTVDNIDGHLTLTLNSQNMPELHVSNGYKNMIVDYSKSKPSKQQKNALVFVKQKLDSAKWFIDAIKQRQNTLLNTMNSIIEYQYDFFLTNDEYNLKPMILKDIAEKIDLDISTISRVVNSKYVQTEFGIFSLKSFFSESMTTTSGEEVSSREIKQILQECVDNEDKKKPLTDEKLTAILQKKGYKIARRTVAKYREQLNIRVGRLRKEL
ncbi:MAG: RNA polymerase factor sigma-54 [Bacteroidetes bacterium]|nr:RNA polymerase factor sigma-54 [Bacteroidota bacterium]